MFQNNNSTPPNGDFADQARSDDDTLMGHVQPAHHENEEARHQGDNSPGSDTVEESPTQEHPSAPESSVRQSPSDQQNLPHQAVVTVQPSPPGPLCQTVAEGFSRAADSSQTDTELLRAAAESLEVAAPSPTISGESSTEQQSNDNPQEQTQQSSPQVPAGLFQPLP